MTTRCKHESYYLVDYAISPCAIWLDADGKWDHARDTPYPGKLVYACKCGYQRTIFNPAKPVGRIPKRILSQLQRDMDKPGAYAPDFKLRDILPLSILSQMGSDLAHVTEKDSRHAS